MTSAATTKDPALSIGTLALNDCRTVCRALKLRASELNKMGKKLCDLDRPTEATSVASEASDIITRLGPRFDEQGTFSFGPGPNEKPEKKNGKGKQGRPVDLAEEARERVKRGAK